MKVNLITLMAVVLALAIPFESTAAMTAEHDKIKQITREGNKKVQGIMSSMPNVEETQKALSAHFEDCWFKQETPANASVCRDGEVKQLKHMLEMIDHAKSKEADIRKVINDTIAELKAMEFK